MKEITMNFISFHFFAVVFMSALVKHLMLEDGVQAVNPTLRPVMEELARRASQASLMNLQHGLLRAALVLTKAGPSSAALLLQVSAPRDRKRGRTWTETLLGYLLSLSCLPGSGQDSDGIFNDVVAQVLGAEKYMLCTVQFI